MKKTILFAFLAILIVSLAPAVLADDGSDHVDADDSADVDDSDASSRERGNVKARMLVRSENARDHMPERAKLKYMEARDRYQHARTLAAHARDRAKLAKEHLKEARGKLADHKRSLDACRGQDNDDCAGKRAEAKGDAINVLVSATDRVLAMLETAKERAENSDLEDKAEIVAKIDAQIAEINAAKENVDALGEDSSPKDVRAAAKELRGSLGGSKAALKNSANKLVGKKLGFVVGKSRQLVNRIDNAVAKLEKRGADVSGIDVDGLKAKVQEAIDMHSAGNYREAHSALKEVHKLLRDAVKGIKAVQGGSDAIDESGDDADEADDDADEADDEADDADDDADDADDDADEAEGDDEEAEDEADESEDEESDDEADETDDESDDSDTTTE